MQSVSRDFQLPIFRPETQKNLQAERLTERDRRYIVRTLSTMLLSTNPHPSMSDCSVPAKAIVKEYTFLADASEDGKEMFYFILPFPIIIIMQFSWMKFISQRCSNVNRGESADAPKPKRSKVEIKGKHQYVDDVNSIIVDDEISLERNMKRMSSELSKTISSPKVLDELMKQTYPNRRASVLGGGVGVLEICDKFPLLRKPKHVRTFFCEMDKMIQI